MSTFFTLLLSSACTTWGIVGRKRRLSAALWNAWAGGMLYRDSVSLTPLIQVFRGASSCFAATESCVICTLSTNARNRSVAVWYWVGSVDVSEMEAVCVSVSVFLCQCILSATVSKWACMMGLRVSCIYRKVPCFQSSPLCTDFTVK